MALNDFSPGIKARVQPANINFARGTILGAANSAGTYRCTALPDGSLAPLPEVVNYYTPPLPIALTDVTGGAVTISGYLEVGPIDLGMELHIAYEGNRISSNRRFWYWQRYLTQAAATDYPATFPTCYDTFTGGRPTNFHPYRAHPTDAKQPGYPGVVAGWFAGGGGHEAIWGMFPDPANPTTNAVKLFGTVFNPTLGIAHQGRALEFDQGSYAHGAGGHVWTHDEDIWYTNANLPTVGNLSADTFGMETATGYSAVTSSSYAELILLKEREGGLFVQGDIGDPTGATVRRLPGIPVLGNFRHMPAVTPLGTVFLARNSGAWIWTGGENAEHISNEAIDGNDFIVPNSNFIDFFGRIYPWYEYVLFPNNWCWNWKQQNWWRLEDPNVVQGFWFGPIDDSGALKILPSKWNGTGSLVRQAVPATPAASYLWSSLPMPIGQDRGVEIREIVFVVSGQSDFTFTLYNRDGSTEVHTMTINSLNAPVYIRKNSHVECQQLLLTIAANGNPTYAGVVHEVRFGIRPSRLYPQGTP